MEGLWGRKSGEKWEGGIWVEIVEGEEWELDEVEEGENGGERAREREGGFEQRERVWKG